MSKIEARAGSYPKKMTVAAPHKKISAASVAARAALAERPSRGLVASRSNPERSGLPTALAVLALLSAAGCGASDAAPTIHADGEHPEKVIAVMKSGPSDPAAATGDPSPVPAPIAIAPMVSGSVSAVAAPVPTPHVRYAGVRAPVHPRPPPPAGGPSGVAGPSTAGCPTPSPPTY